TARKPMNAPDWLHFDQERDLLIVTPSSNREVHMLSSSSSTWMAASVLAGVVLATPTTGSAANLKTIAVKSPAAQAQPYGVEDRIKTLHSQLRITPEQEAAWKNVADAMRENAKTMNGFQSQEAESERTATAPDMISAYGKETDAHADAIKKFAAA